MADFKDEDKIDDKNEDENDQQDESVSHTATTTTEDQEGEAGEDGNAQDEDNKEINKDNNQQSDGTDPQKDPKSGISELQDDQAEDAQDQIMEEDKEAADNLDQDKIEAGEGQEEFQEKSIIPADNAKDTEKSEEFAHMNENDSVEKATSAMDAISFENIGENHMDFSKDMSREKEKMKDPTEERKTLEQPLKPGDGSNEMADTMTSNLISRGNLSSFNTTDQADMERENISNLASSQDVDMDTMDTSEKEHAEHWRKLCSQTSEKSQYLTEQLRLIIEPTKVTRLRGDYSSGKRLNMRRIIPYIASNFRKDKIWLRRTRPAKRDCQIVIAVDDSSSMSDNRVKEMCFQSMGTICQAMSTLEVGKLAVVKFGAEAKVVLPFKDSFSATDGANILSKFSFAQTKTELLKLLNLSNNFFDLNNSRPLSKLLIILSDGKGVLNEGKTQVIEALRKTRLNGIFVVYVILESQENSESVLDIRTATFDKNNKLTMESYMDSFPFPFYMILRDIEKLPLILSDALRQWFELLSTS